MKNLLLSEFLKLRIPYIASLLIVVVYSSLMFIPVTSGYRYSYNIEIWVESTEVFMMVFPLFSVIPTMWLMYYEKKNGFISYIQTRISRKKYILVKWLVSSFGGATIIFVGSFIGVIISLLFLPDVENLADGNTVNAFGEYYFVNNPLLYGFILSLWRMFLGFLIATLGFILSLFIGNLFVILTAPFIYGVLENFVLSVLGVPYFRLVTSFGPSTLDANAITVTRLLVGPSLLLLVTCMTFLYFYYIKKTPIFENT